MSAGRFGDVTPQEAREVTINNYLYWVGSTVLYYDHFATLGREVTYIWGHKKIPYGFLLNRYMAFFGNMISAALYYNESKQSCRRAKLVRQILLVFTEVLVCILLGTRTYALYLHSRRILLIIVPILLCGVAFSTWALLAQATPAEVALYGCDEKLSLESSIYLASPWECLFVYDLVIFYLTFRKTYKTASQDRQIRGRASIRTLMFKDQAIYFMGMATANLANLLTFYLAPPYLKGSLTQFASVISVTLVSRLILNLHDHLNEAELPRTSMTTLQFSTEYELGHLRRATEPGGEELQTFRRESRRAGMTSIETEGSTTVDDVFPGKS